MTYIQPKTSSLPEFIKLGVYITMPYSFCSVSSQVVLSGCTAGSGFEGISLAGLGSGCTISGFFVISGKSILLTKAFFIFIISKGFLL